MKTLDFFFVIIWAKSSNSNYNSHTRQAIMYWNYKVRLIIPRLSTPTLIRPRNRSEITPGKLNS